MCGICGFNFENKDLLEKMSSLIKHRGPDDSGRYIDHNVSLGMRRLSIIDLVSGAQPQTNENGDIWIIFNGEIYNFLILRQELKEKGHKFSTNSDTESIVHAYEEWGINCVNKLRGQFAFCIYDTNQKILFLARDHMGLKPLYYYFNGEHFVFGSEIKCLFPYGLEKVVNKEVLNLILSLKYSPFNETLFKGVLKLPPSSYLIFDLNKKKIKTKKYWKINFQKQSTKDLDILVQELRDLLYESIKIRMISDVPLGVFLSGGLDSSGVVGILSKFSDSPIKTFSIGFEEGAPINETKYAQYISNYYQTKHTELMIKSSSLDIIPQLIWYLDDLIVDPAIIPIHLMAKYSRDKIRVALTGDGADEIFAGYKWYYKSINDHYINLFPKFIFNQLMKINPHIPSHKLRILLSRLNFSKMKYGSFYNSIITISDSEKLELINFPASKVLPQIKKKFLNNIDQTSQYINWDLKYQLPNQYNMKIDKMTMAASLEARLPYLDYKIVDWSVRIPSNLKLKGNIEKYILRLALKDIVPNKILKRKKTGFGTPVSFWIRKDFKEVCAELLERLLKRNDLFKPKFIKLVKKNLNRELYLYRIWTLVMFEIWYETFIENDGYSPIRI